jgi:hypothetical protein
MVLSIITINQNDIKIGLSLSQPKLPLYFSPFLIHIKSVTKFHLSMMK